jgi:hypothetical protein
LPIPERREPRPSSSWAVLASAAIS